MPDALDLLKTRRSIPAQFLAEPAPTEAELMTLLTIATRVPDHGKLAPWRFVLFRGDNRQIAGERIANLVRTRKPDATEAEIAAELTRFTRAPLVVGILSRAAQHVKIPIWEQQLSAGAVAMNLELGAHAMGFAACWLTEWVAYDDEAAALLGAKSGERVVGFVHIGTPTIPPQDRPRPDLAEIVSDWAP